jgi:hypothetical protein
MTSLVPSQADFKFQKLLGETFGKVFLSEKVLTQKIRKNKHYCKTIRFI